MAHNTPWFALASSALVLVSLGGCGESHRSKSTSVPVTKDMGSQASEPIPEGKVMGWAEVQKVDAGGAERVELSTDDGRTFEVANPAALSEVADGQAVSFVGEELANLATGERTALAVETAVVGGPPPVYRKLPTAASAAASVELTGAPAVAAVAVAASPVAVNVAPTPAPVMPDPWASRHNMTAAQYQAEVTALAQLGLYPAKVHVAGSGSSARYTAVWVKDGLPRAARHGGTSATYQQQVEELAGLGFRVASVTAYGSYPNERYAATFVKDGKGWASHHRMTSAQYQAKFSEYAQAGLRPVWISVIGTPGSERYTASWVKDGKGGKGRHLMTRKQFRAELDHGGSKWNWRLASVSEYGDRIAAVWVSDTSQAAVNNLVFQHQTASQYQTTTNLLAKDGFHPTFAIKVGSRYTSGWARDDAPWILRARGAWVSELKAVDAALKAYMKDRKVTSATLAVAKNGKLVFSRGYSYGPPTKALVQPSSRIRIASISKPITATAIMQLREKGLLSLNDKMAKFFPSLKLLDSGPFNLVNDDRFWDLQVKDLLRHRTGWASRKTAESDAGLYGLLGFDPMVSHDWSVAGGKLSNLPVSSTTIITYMATKKTMQYDPGKYYNYSNFGFNILGRIVERVSGMSYEAYVRKNVLAPVGAGGMRVADSRFHKRRPGEVLYIDPRNMLSTDVMGTDHSVPNAYGGWNVGAMDSHGGWVASAEELVRFARRVDDETLVNSASRSYMFTKQSDASYGMGWGVNSSGLASHGGYLWGCSTALKFYKGGVVYAVLVNQSYRDGQDLPGLAWCETGAGYGSRIEKALDSVTVWPN